LASQTPATDSPRRADKADRRTAFARTNGAQNVDSRDDGAEVVRRPADKGEDIAWREGNDIAMPVDDLLGGDPAEAYPALDALLDPNQIDISEHVSRNRDHDAAPSSEKARASISRSMSVTVVPRRRASSLMRPRT
jgi:hypothetical protein